MNYEKKYKEALERAIFVKENTHSIGAKDISDVIEYIFHELKDNKDELMRRKFLALIEWAKSYAASGISSDEAKEMTTWLEKQGEPTDKVDSKFHEGDWVVHTATGIAHQIKCPIENVTNKTYGYSLIDGGYISSVEEVNYHLWTIRDAKDGDVLSTDSGNTFIYHKHDNNYVYYHCSINYFDTITINSSWNILGNKPATKGQRDLLFQKMKEAGYEWDAREERIKSIEQKPAWSEEDERLYSCIIEEQEESLDNVKNDKYGHSEIISDLKDMYRERINWLKSLKQRIGG